MTPTRVLSPEERVLSAIEMTIAEDGVTAERAIESLLNLVDAWAPAMMLSEAEVRRICLLAKAGAL